jgi:3',5'-cyclic AMP phosphodiesterase CpdA
MRTARPFASALLTLAVSAAFSGVVGCTSPDETAGPGGSLATEPSPLPALTRVRLTTDEILAPVHAVDAQDSPGPQDVELMNTLLSQGFGEMKLVAGEPIQPTTFDGSAPPAPGPKAAMLTRFVHLADTQLADDESPARLVAFDTPAATRGAFRPQEGHECRVLNAAVRTINFYNEQSKVDFVLLGGDNADNAQSNEVEWFNAILNGAERVECDSGEDDDPIPGPDNDPKDAFIAEGLNMPWRWVMGNHDILMQGNFPVEPKKKVAVGVVATSGTRDWAQPGGPVVSGQVIADERRAMLARPELLAKLSQDDDGHGIDSAVVKYGKAYYTFDIDTKLRVLVMDSAAATGGSEGVIHQSDVDKFMKPALDQAKAEGKWVILTSHHSSLSLGNGVGLGGAEQADALTPEAFQDLLGQYDNILMHLAGHTHVHEVRKIEPPGGHAYWELKTAALADFPHQMRVIEIYDQDNGYLSIRGIALDYSTEGDPIAEEGRLRGVVDFTSGWVPDGRGEQAARNVELWIKKP